VGKMHEPPASTPETPSMLARRTVRRVAIVAAALLLGSCSEPFAPSDLAGLYGMRSNEIVYPGVPGLIGTYWISSDSIVMNFGGSGIRRTRVLEAVDGGPPNSYFIETPFDFRIDGHAVTLSNSCGSICAVVHRSPMTYDLWGSLLMPRDGSGALWQRVGPPPQ
jgi:hypothetical protein